MSKIVRLQMAWMEIDPFFFQVLPLACVLEAPPFRYSNPLIFLGHLVYDRRHLALTGSQRGKSGEGSLTP